ncbi:MAG: rane protein of unknown function [Modestobacter sp.]|nr:rane protein of unknown function [Modestobacter sp.]
MRNDRPPVMITAVIVAWIAIGLFLVALPFFAWWLGGWRFLSRPSGDVEATALGRTVAQRHGLRPAQAALVQRAVTWGRALEEPELRVAAVDWAQQLVELRRRRRAARRQLRGWLVVVLVLWVTFILARVSFAVAQGRWSDVNWSTVVCYSGGAIAGWRLHTGPGRAIERNSGPPS